MEEKFNTIFAEIIQKYRVQVLRSFISEFLPVLEEHGFTFDDLLNAIADYMHASGDLALGECVPTLEKMIDCLRKLKTGANHE